MTNPTFAVCSAEEWPGEQPIETDPRSKTKVAFRTGHPI